MNMNRSAVDAALGLAGNMPLSDEDKRYNNLVYVFCKNLYLPVLFNSLCEIDWRSARKEGALHLSERYTLKSPGLYYYEMPADCVRPLLVDDNSENFKNDSEFIVTERPAGRLYYVFHKRSAGGSVLAGAAGAGERDGAVIFRRPDNEAEAFDPRIVYARAEADLPENDDDFPEWEYTAYEPDFWTFFSYKLAAALAPKLRADDGAGARVQSLEALAAAKGEEAVRRSRAAAVNPRGQYKSWAETCGLSVSPGDYYSGAGVFYKGK
jgi:hypothetical protein